MKAVFEYARSQGVLNVAVAGNDSTDQPFYRAAFGEYVIRSESAKRMTKLEALLADLRILGLGRGEAEEAASIMVNLAKKGQPIEMRDALIAGCMLGNA